MPVNANSHVPIYEQIIEHVCGLVATGVHRGGESLPSVRALAVELMVNPNTIQRAYRELESVGLIETRRGLGMFVAPHAADGARRRMSEAIQARFREGVYLGLAARMSRDEMQELFDRVFSQSVEASASCAMKRAEESSP